MPDPTTLTGIQYRLLTAITEAVDTRGYPPSMRELRAATGLTSTASISYQLRALEEKGYITRAPGKARGIVITVPSSAVCCPTCGQPTPAPEGT